MKCVTRLAALVLLALSACSGQQAQPPAPKAAERASPFPPGFEETYFTGAEPLDEKLWNGAFAVHGVDPSKPPPQTYRRIEMKFVAGTARRGENKAEPYKGLCEDFALNMKLHGGMWQAGCSVMPIHPDHPHAALFHDVRWTAIDPIANFDIVRIRSRANCDSLSDTFRKAPDDIDECWKGEAMAWRRVLLENRLIVEEASVDIDNDGAPDQLFRFAIRNAYACYAADGSTGYRWRFVRRPDDDVARSFNWFPDFGGNVFLYGEPGKETAYIWHEGGYISVGSSRQAVDRGVYHGPARYYSDQRCAWTWDFTLNL